MIYSRTDTLNLAKADGRDWNSEAALVARTRIDKPADIAYEEAIGLGLETDVLEFATGLARHTDRLEATARQADQGFFDRDGKAGQVKSQPYDVIAEHHTEYWRTRGVKPSRQPGEEPGLAPHLAYFASPAVIAGAGWAGAAVTATTVGAVAVAAGGLGALALGGMAAAGVVGAVKKKLAQRELKPHQPLLDLAHRGVHTFEARIEETPDQRVNFEYTETGALRDYRTKTGGEQWHHFELPPHAELRERSSVTFTSQRGPESQVYQKIGGSGFDKEQAQLTRDQVFIQTSHTPIRYPNYTELPEFKPEQYQEVASFAWPARKAKNIVERENQKLQRRAVELRDSVLSKAEEFRQLDGAPRDFSVKADHVTLVPSFFADQKPGEMRGEAIYQGKSDIPQSMRVQDKAGNRWGVEVSPEGVISYYTRNAMVTEDRTAGKLTLFQRPKEDKRPAWD